jgi:hypothetical protein
MTDLATIVTASRTIEILHPGTGDRLGVRVNVVHIDDERLAKEKRRITDRRLYLEARGKTFKAEEIEENKNILLFSAMTGWEWYNPTGEPGAEGYDESAMPTFDGSEQPEFNRKTVFAVLEKLPWFSDQVNEAVGETKAFFSHSKQN